MREETTLGNNVFLLFERMFLKLQGWFSFLSGCVSHSFSFVFVRNRWCADFSIAIVENQPSA